MSTLSTLRSNVRRDASMNDEGFISDALLNSFINKGIQEAERIIHNLYEDYFLDHAALTESGSTGKFGMPSDIYANKIRMVYYKGSDNYKYPIHRVRDIKYTLHESDNSLEWYQRKYLVTNNSTNGTLIELHPQHTTDLPSGFYIWYIRSAKQLTSDSDACDIPEFESYIEIYARVKCLEKIGIDPTIQLAMKELESEKVLMEKSLTEKIPDNDDMIESDLSYYEDFNDGRIF